MRYLLFTLFLIGVLSCSKPDRLVVNTQVTGILNTNCYLIYTENTREAVLIDVGDTIGNLTDIIEDQELSLKYILITHAHPDHIYGVQQVKNQYPDVKICFSREEFEDMQNVYAQWDARFPESIANQIKGNPAVLKLFNMDYEAIGEPDIYLEDQTFFKLGKHQITCIQTPGHARGSICYYIPPYLFSGDELYYRGVGNTKTSPSSSWALQVKSIRYLYSILPDSTIVYPGHGQPTSVVSEKKENPVISEDQLHPK